ncbi:MAG: hypothetical protein A3J37_02895 [Alphaproteobacteria bacterium RIFCSPHIGHO2_12_FULL_45_9]|nr:MAG: hypothetical protein A3B66_08360 [Alphaproteobacteria bacterium RIFCSPHIGHO2_02_FULL_46_13]OFW98089.1 MAG: hypothetical protein A3J37_02895 [Alphaproteobacteria bacterium RIFCSPHIGHO2_12_FULL_45_9]
MKNNNAVMPLINQYGRGLVYAFEIASTAKAYTVVAMNQGYNEPNESYQYTRLVLGRDMRIENGGDIQKYYIGRGEESLVLSAALQIAMGIFAQKITDIFAQPDLNTLRNLKIEFGLVRGFPGDEERIQAAAQERLVVEPEVSAFLASAEHRDMMRGRFPDANLSDERISLFLPQPV